MNILIVTQKVDENDDVLGFFISWLKEFALNFKKVTVICLEQGQYNLPANVSVLSLGKEKSRNKFLYFLRLYKYVLARRKDYDIVFVHMNPIYIGLAGWLWKIMGKKIALWYTHKQVDFKLRFAEKFCDLIFTASKSSFTLESKKVRIVGHGIDVGRFKMNDLKLKKEDNIVKILHIGRITPIKNIDVLVEATRILKENWKQNFKVILVGAPTTEDDVSYSEKIAGMVRDYNLQDYIEILGSVPNKDIVSIYKQAEISVNLTPTGGIDKSVLESMASGVIPLVSNEGFRDYFGPYSSNLIFKFKDYNDLAQKIMDVYSKVDRSEMVEFLIKEVTLKSDVRNLIGRMRNFMANLGNV